MVTLNLIDIITNQNLNGYENFHFKRILLKWKPLNSKFQLKNDKYSYSENNK